MFVYHYNPETLAYMGSSACEFDQLEPGRISAPAFATTTQPPADWPMRVGMHPFYVPEKEAWEMRQLPPPAVEEPEPEPEPKTAEQLRAEFEAHMQSARDLLAKLEEQQPQAATLG